MNIIYNTLIDMAIVMAAGALTWALIAYFRRYPSHLPVSMVIARPRMSSSEKRAQRERVLRFCGDCHGRNLYRPCDGPTGKGER